MVGGITCSEEHETCTAGNGYERILSQNQGKNKSVNSALSQYSILDSVSKYIARIVNQ